MAQQEDFSPGRKKFHSGAHSEKEGGERIRIHPFILPEDNYPFGDSGKARATPLGKRTEYPDESAEESEIFAKIRGDKSIIPGNTDLFERGGFGEIEGDSLELSAEETMYLFEKGKLSVILPEGKKAKDFDRVLLEFRNILPEIYIRYQLYRDLRDRGYVVRSGLKYGTHFRVYDRGVKPTRGERETWEHAKFLAHSIPESAVYTISELSRFVRLAHSVRKTLWLGVVDGEGDVSYFQITRATP